MSGPTGAVSCGSASRSRGSKLSGAPVRTSRLLPSSGCGPFQISHDAQILGHNDAAKLLEQTLKEEEAADEKLNELAEGGINEAAAVGASGKDE
jgi:hypothetical protein